MFSGSDPALVELEVNKFLRDHAKMMVHSVLQSSDYSRVHVTIFFNVRTKAAKMKEAAISEVAVNIKPSEIPSN
jgi:hypothetical protein